jgi:hypothetical protein
MKYQWFQWSPVHSVVKIVSIKFSNSAPEPLPVLAEL